MCSEKSAEKQQVWLVDEALKNRLGHWYEYDRAAITAIESSGWFKVTLLGNRAMSDEIQQELSAERVFRFTNWDGIYESSSALKRYLGVLVHNHRMYLDLHRFLRETDRPDYLFAPTVVLHHLLGFYILARLHRSVTLVLMIRNNIAVYDGRTRRFRRTAIFWKWMLWLYNPLIRASRARFVTDSQYLADEVAELAGTPCRVIPHPSLIGFSNDAVKEKGAEGRTAIRLFLPGPARYEKGIDLLLQALEWLAAEKARKGDLPNILLTIQWAGSFTLPSGEVFSMETLAESTIGSIINILDKPLTSAEYEHHLAMADVIVLPYRREAYYARISGVAVEALLKAKPTVYFEGTWLAQLMKSYDVGIECEEDPASLADAILRAIVSLDDLRHTAELAAPRVKKDFSAERFVEGLFGE